MQPDKLIANRATRAAAIQRTEQMLCALEVAQIHASMKGHAWQAGRVGEDVEHERSILEALLYVDKCEREAGR